ncbi:unnamed protein product, partial [Didymodactylos carnosus]
MAQPLNLQESLAVSDIRQSVRKIRQGSEKDYRGQRSKQQQKRQRSIGLTKPNLTVTLKSIINQLLELKRDGISLVLNEQQTKFDIEFLLFTADSPALSLFSNFISSSGLSSCYFCLDPGVYNVDLHKVLYKNGDSEARSLKNYYQDAAIAHEKIR